MRTMTMKEFVIREFNKMLEEEGSDVRIVATPPRPRLAASEGEVVAFRKGGGDVAEEVSR
jgi:hypothetical protein